MVNLAKKFSHGSEAVRAQGLYQYFQGSIIRFFDNVFCYSAPFIDSYHYVSKLFVKETLE